MKNTRMSIVSEQSSLYDNNHYHEECLRCNSCGVNLSGTNQVNILHIVSCSLWAPFTFAILFGNFVNINNLPFNCQFA